MIPGANTSNAGFYPIANQSSQVNAAALAEQLNKLREAEGAAANSMEGVEVGDINQQKILQELHSFVLDLVNSGHTPEESQQVFDNIVNDLAQNGSISEEEASTLRQLGQWSLAQGLGIKDAGQKLEARIKNASEEELNNLEKTPEFLEFKKKTLEGGNKLSALTGLVDKKLNGGAPKVQGSYTDPDLGPKASDHMFRDALTAIEQMFQGKIPFYAMAIQAMLYGYQVNNANGSYQVYRQAKAQNVSKNATDLNQFLNDLQAYINQHLDDGTDPESINLYDLLNTDDGKALLDKYKDQFAKAGIDLSLSWDKSDKDRQSLTDKLNGYINYVNNLTKGSENYSAAAIVPEFKVDSSGNINIKEAKDKLDAQRKACDQNIAEKTTLDNQITAGIQQIKETINALIDMIKQFISSYGQSIKQY